MDNRVKISYASLMAYAKNPEDTLTQAFAGVLQSTWIGEGASPEGMGLPLNELMELLGQYFPGASQVLLEGRQSKDATGACPDSRADEFEDVLNLLLDHRNDDSDATSWLAHAIATGCMGNNHLWQDMGLSGREVLSHLLKTHFTALFQKNVGNMKWKKFFYKQLCDRAEVQMCKAPSCQVCDDYKNCFGPEDAVASNVVTLF